MAAVADADPMAMSSDEQTQSASRAGRWSIDSVLIGLVVGIPALIAAGALGLFG